MPALGLGTRAARATRAALTRTCATAAEEGAKRPRYKRKTLPEVASYLPERGVGARFVRLMWIRNGYENSWWTVTRVVDRKSGGRVRYYGRLTWKGVENAERPVNAMQKRGWRFLVDGDGGAGGREGVVVKGAEA